VVPSEEEGKGIGDMQLGGGREWRKYVDHLKKE